MASHTLAIVLIAGMMKVRVSDPTPFRNGPTTLVNSQQLQAPLLRHAGGQIQKIREKKEGRWPAFSLLILLWPASSLSLFLLQPLASFLSASVPFAAAGQLPQCQCSLRGRWPACWPSHFHPHSPGGYDWKAGQRP